MYTRKTLLTFLFLLPFAHAQQNAKIPDPDPEIERKSFILPPGFEVNLFAADPLLAKPIQMNWDSQGRLWVATSEIYPQIVPGQKANDKIIILEDTKKVGVADKTTVFADGLLIPTGVEPDGRDGAYVANSTELVHLSTSKPGGKADTRKVMLSGFGTEDTHHIIHTFRWGPDGALYFNQSIYIHSHLETPAGVKRLNGGGIWRYKPEKHSIDVFARGWVNSWGHAFDKYGQSIVTDGAGGEGINHAIPGAYYMTAVGASRILHGMNPGSPKFCGVEIVSSRNFPDDWQGDVITNDFRGHRVCRFKLQEDGSSFISREQTELIKSNHPAFRPIDVKMGPDGAIYIADWYNPIIQHGEVDFRDPRRDHTHGRIWRITYKGRPLVPARNLDNAKVEELIQMLKAPEAWTRDHARKVLVRTKLEALANDVPNMTMAENAGQFELELAWLFQSLGRNDFPALAKCLESSLGPVRSAAVRIVAMDEPDPKKAFAVLSKAVTDPNPRVRLEAVRGLARLNTTEAANAAMTVLEFPMDVTLDYALWLTIKELAPVWLPEFQAGRLNFAGDPKALAFALDAAGSGDAVKSVLNLIKAGKLPPEKTTELWVLVARLGGPAELHAVLQQANATKNSVEKDRLTTSVEEAVRLRKVPAPVAAAKELETLIGLNNPVVKGSALRLAGLWKQEVLRKKLMSETQGTSARAALDGLVLLGGAMVETYFAELLKSDLKPVNRHAVLSAWAGLNVITASTNAVEYLSNATPTAELEDIFRDIITKKGGPQALAKALNGKTLPADIAKIGLRAARASAANVPALADALSKAGNLAAAKAYPTEAEVKTITAEVLANGNAARGEAVFRRKELQCLNCHAIAGAGGQVGPDMTSIGASAPPDYLVESILNPNKAVKEGYHAVKVTLLSGGIVQGVPIREAEGVLTLRDAEDKEIKIPINQIDEKVQTRSLMPDALADPLTRQDLVDLVRFMSELGKVGGNYAPSTARLVRKWEAVDASTTNTNIMRRTRASAVADPASNFVWNKVYAQANGTLPLAEVPQFTVWNNTAAQSAIRFKLNVTTAGKVRLKFSTTKGVSAYIGAVPIDLQTSTEVDVPIGEVWVTLLLDRSQSGTDLRVELDDVVGSGARVTITGGK